MSIEAKYDFCGRFRSGLAVVQVKGKWGFVDKAGKVIVKPSYERAHDFSAGLALVGSTDIERYIDAKGKCILESQVGPKLEEPKKVKHLFPVVEKDKWGYIDTKGNVVVKPQFEQADDFAEGLAAVKLNGKYGIIDKKGNFVISPRLDSVPGGFSGGLIPVRLGSNCGFLDRAGRIAIDLCFSKAEAFREGLAAVILDGTVKPNPDDPDNMITEGRHGYIDSAGRLRIRPQFAGAQPFYEGFAAVSDNENRWRFVDVQGRPLGDKTFSEVMNFAEGLAPVNSDGRWGYMDTEGKIAIPFQYNWAWPFSEGLAFMMSPERHNWGFIDKKGKIVIDPIYEDAWEFSEGLAAVQVGDKYGFIDKKANMVIQPRFDSTYHFKNGLAQVIEHEQVTETLREGPVIIGEHTVTKQKIGYIDRTGKFVWTPRR
jgi:hypothetical protein